MIEDIEVMQGKSRLRGYNGHKDRRDIGDIGINEIQGIKDRGDTGNKGIEEIQG